VRLYLVDGSGYIFRAYHALPPLTRKSDGMPVGAVQGFCNMLWKLLVEMRTAPDGPTHLAVIFDQSGKTFRNDLYPAYKAHRPPAPEDLIPQFALVREATRAFGVPAIELANYEADDLIAAYATHVRDMGGEAVIVSSDKDMMQLVGDRVMMLDTMKNLKIGPEQVFDKFGVSPDKVVDLQALTGDSVDNVPGAPGIGVKTAALLINEYGDLDTVLARAGRSSRKSAPSCTRTSCARSLPACSPRTLLPAASTFPPLTGWCSSTPRKTPPCTCTALAAQHATTPTAAPCSFCCPRRSRR
jgi:DNA polymerase-1